VTVLTDVPLRSLGKILVANRGEIAVRVLRTLRDLDLCSVAVFADPDADALHVRLADQAVRLPGATAAETYLNIEALLAAARQSGAHAVHPGYGFLSENAEFAQAVLDGGLTWIGPGPEAIRRLGDKVAARAIAREVGAPLAAGTADPVRSSDEILAFAAQHGFPVAIKAAFGGGGRGLKVARDADEVPELFASATREAQGAFGRGECFIERYLERSRHVEAQVIADNYGTVLVVGTRDCSLQRRHQKLVEEAPAPFLTEDQLTTIQTSARAICAAVGYAGAGTVEYLLGADGTLSFLEVNTRLQVEHPVTEETTGIDLVAEQIRVAAGARLTVGAMPPPRGHAIEFRINAEDPGRGFLPSPGTISELRLPAGPGVRVDSGVEAGSVIGGQFDSLLAKLIVTGSDRADALRRSRRALAELQIDGLATLLPFHRQVVEEPAFVGNAEAFDVHNRWVETEFENRIAPYGDPHGDHRDPGELVVRVGGRALAVRLPGVATLGERAAAMVRSSSVTGRAEEERDTAGRLVRAPMQGTLTKIAVTEGATVRAGDLIAVVEAMKMENPVVANRDGVVTGLAAVVGDTVSQGTALCELC
jgi:acetyl-CoA/propionyl-CoA carboxylase biotin carboxyl carrier protein